MALPIKCPLCECDIEKQEVVTQHVYGNTDRNRAFFHCLECDVRYLYPLLTPDEESRFYNSEFENFMGGRSGLSGGWEGAEKHIQANSSTRIRRLKYLETFIRKGDSLLEVGCSSGFMIIPFKDDGYECTGIEPSGIFSDYVKKKGITVYSSIEQMVKQEPKHQFDIIIHFFVLEHVSNPMSFLDVQLSLLKPGGKIVFEIPNADDPLLSVYDIPEFEKFYWSVAHPWYFNEKSLKFLLDRIGQSYEIILDQRYDLSNHMIWARDGKPGGVGRFSKFFGNDFDLLYRQELIRNRKCDTLIAVITKSGDY